METKILIDGIVPDAGTLFQVLENKNLFMGETPFTSFLLLNNQIPFWSLHLERIKKSFEYLFSDYSFESFLEKVLATLKALPKSEKQIYVRMTMIRGEKEIHLITQVKAYEEQPVTNLKLKTQLHPCRVSNVPNYLKYGNYLEALQAVNQAKKAGFDDCFFLDVNEDASECSTSNIFFRKGTQFYSSPLEGPVLDGVTRKVVIEIIKQHGMSFKEVKLKRSEWEEMDEVFVTNSLSGIRSVAKIDQQKYEVNSSHYKKIKKTYKNKLGQNEKINC